MIIPEFQGHPGNDTLTAAISFSETRRNHKGPSEARPGDGVNIYVYSGQELLD
jgi:hypothetical protein